MSLRAPDCLRMARLSVSLPLTTVSRAAVPLRRPAAGACTTAAHPNRFRSALAPAASVHLTSA